MLLGIVTTALTLNPQRLRQQVIIAALIIALGAWLDSQRPIRPVRRSCT
jgi:hypothetical protein